MEKRIIVPTSTSERIINFIEYHGQTRAYDLYNAFGISKVAVHKQLRKLLKNGKIKKSGKPPLVIYTMSTSNIINLVQLEKIKRKICPVLKKANVKKASLFGSYVRGDNTNNSDIDVLVDMPDHATLIELAGIKQDLEELLHKKVDVVTYNGICPMLKGSILDSQYPIL